MGRSSKRLRKVEESSEEDDDNMESEMLNVDSEIDDDSNGEYEDEDEEDGGTEEEEQQEDADKQNDDIRSAEMEELEKEYKELQHEEQDIFMNLKGHKDDDLQKGQAVKNQKTLWDKTLEFRVLLQKAFSSSNRLPQEPIRSSFCDSDNEVNEAYLDLIMSSKKTLDTILELQEALVDKNPAIKQPTDGNFGSHSKQIRASRNSNEEGDEEWLQISQMHSRLASFRNKSIDKWQRKTEVTTGAAAVKGKLKAFNQNISEQVAAYMRDPSNSIKGMQQRRSAVAIFGTIPDSNGNPNAEVPDSNGNANANAEVMNVDGDPEVLDDTEFYQLLLKEFLETTDPSSCEMALYAMKRSITKKRKIVDRRASKSRKIRYNVHEKIVNFMAPEPFNVPQMATKLFENLFGLKTKRPASGP